MFAEDVTFQHTMHFQRDFPVPYDIVVENIGDQSHVPFAHHGVAGSRYSPYTKQLCEDACVHHKTLQMYHLTETCLSKVGWLESQFLLLMLWSCSTCLTVAKSVTDAAMITSSAIWQSSLFSHVICFFGPGLARQCACMQMLCVVNQVVCAEHQIGPITSS